MTNRKYLHYLTLAGAIALGTILRFWNLDLKPLWMDEVITAIFSLGKDYSQVPMEVVFPLKGLQEVFSFQPGVSCSQIAANLATQSTHPPLFFCLMYSWLGLIGSWGKDWVTDLRSLSALFGVGAIAAIYFVNRIAFSQASGLTAALFMAVSPFAVYLSQEARHYTLPMFLITLSLLGLVQIQQDIFQRQVVRFWVWLAWVIINIIGLYVHYFFILALSAEIATLVFLIFWGGANLNKFKIWFALILSISAVAIGFLPWLLVMLNHSSRAETNWIQAPTNIAPLYQILINWVLMVIVIPVENLPLPIAIISGLLMFLFGLWVGQQAFKGLKYLGKIPATHLATVTLLTNFVLILFQLFALVYLSGKDITIVPRYHFVYYPNFCVLLAAGVHAIYHSKFPRKNHKYIILIVGILSSVLVIYNLAFQKPFHPEKVAQNMNLNPSIGLMLVVAYRDYQDVALGLSFALALEPLREIGAVRKEVSLPFSNVAFFKQSPDFQSVWQKLSQVSTPTSTLNLWVVGPGRKRRDYPPTLTLRAPTTCIIDPKQHYRIGIPYQLYRCGNVISTTPPA